MATDTNNPENRLIEFIKRLGLPVALVCYYIIKDWIFTEKLMTLMTKVELYLSAVGGVR